MTLFQTKELYSTEEFSNYGVEVYTYKQGYDKVIDDRIVVGVLGASILYESGITKKERKKRYSYLMTNINRCISLGYIVKTNVPRDYKDIQKNIKRKFNLNHLYGSLEDLLDNEGTTLLILPNEYVKNPLVEYELCLTYRYSKLYHSDYLLLRGKPLLTEPLDGMPEDTNLDITMPVHKFDVEVVDKEIKSCVLKESTGVLATINNPNFKIKDTLVMTGTFKCSVAVILYPELESIKVAESIKNLPYYKEGVQNRLHEYLSELYDGLEAKDSNMGLFLAQGYLTKEKTEGHNEVVVPYY